MADLETMRLLDEAPTRRGVHERGVAADAGWDLAPELSLAVAIVMRHAPEVLEELGCTQMSQAFFDDYFSAVRPARRGGGAVVELAHSRGFRAVRIWNVMSGPNDDPPFVDWGDAGDGTCAFCQAVCPRTKAVARRAAEGAGGMKAEWDGHTWATLGG